MVMSTPSLFASPAVRVFPFYSTVTALLEIPSDLLGDKFPSQFSIFISLELAAAALDVVDNLSPLRPFFTLLLRHYAYFQFVLLVPFCCPNF